MSGNIRKYASKPEQIIGEIVKTIRLHPESYETKIKNNVKIRRLTRECFEGCNLDKSLSVLCDIGFYIYKNYQEVEG